MPAYPQSVPNSPATKPLTIAVVGPTASGKSTLALNLAAALGGEIVNFDSLQLYRGFDIGSAKTPPEERGGVPHYLLDVLDPQQSYSAGEYAVLARRAITEILGHRRLPILVGGTGFYLRATLTGLPELPSRDEPLRERLQRREERRPGSLQRLLNRLEPAAAQRIHSNDVQKLIRALEIRLLTGQALPRPSPEAAFCVLKLGLRPQRALLTERIERRTTLMFAGGLLDEVSRLLAQGHTGGEKPFEALGYRQALLHLRGKCTLAGAMEDTVVATRQYAKRQQTWFRQEADIHWLDGFGDDSAIQRQAMELAKNWLATQGHR